MQRNRARTGQLKLGELLITLIPNLGISFRGDKEFFGFLGEGLHQGVVAHLAHDEVAELAQKKEHPDWNALIKDGRRLTFPQTSAVSSARAGLTSLFGMGRGEHRLYNHPNILCGC